MPRTWDLLRSKVIPIRGTILLEFMDKNVYNIRVMCLITWPLSGSGIVTLPSSPWTKMP